MYTKGIGEIEGNENDMRNEQYAGGPSIRSDGQLYNYQNGYGRERHAEEEKPQVQNGLTERLRNVIGGFETDDLLLIAIGLLLLLDGDADNDVLLIFIIALLFL